MNVVSKLLTEHPDRCAVIIDCILKGAITETIKLLVCKNLAYSIFMCVLRRRMTLNCRENIFVLIKYNNMMLPSHISIGEVYEKHKADDNVLYLVCRRENVFGEHDFLNDKLF